MHYSSYKRGLPLGACLAFALFGPIPSAMAQSDLDEPITVSTGSDQENSIDWSEITELREQVFERMDRNGDGVLSDRDQPSGSSGAQFGSALNNLRSHFDENGDREVSQLELFEAPSTAFSLGDSNGDGVLSRSELGATRHPNDRR